jgi:hypothetical protein
VGLKRSVAWVKQEPFGVEFAEADLTERRLKVIGVTIGADPMPYRLDYQLETRSKYITERLLAVARGEGWTRTLELLRDKYGAWEATASAQGESVLLPPGGDMNLLKDALDCDLAFSPLTNTMPVLRHGLLEGGGPVDLTVAWVSVPDLGVHPGHQRYSFLRREGDHAVVRFESPNFTADVVFDSDGLVVDHPGIGRRL